MLRLRRREQAPLREGDIAGFPYGFDCFHVWIVANQVTIQAGFKREKRYR